MINTQFEEIRFWHLYHLGQSKYSEKRGGDGQKLDELESYPAPGNILGEGECTESAANFPSEGGTTAKE